MITTIIIVILLYILLYVATGRVNNIIDKLTGRKPWNEKTKTQRVESRNDNSRYIISFFIPTVGFILGSILMAKDDLDEQSMGKQCVALAFLSTVVAGILIGVLVSL